MIANSALLALSVMLVGSVQAEGPAGGYESTGSDSFYWHQRYHALLAMASYAGSTSGAVNADAITSQCTQTFTSDSIQHNYPGSTEDPWTILSTWGPTPKLGLSGYIVKVPEMNKVICVFRDVYGWERFNTTLAPLNGFGGDGTYMAMQAAIDGWQEVKNATSDWQAQKDGMGQHIWSTAGHGFGAAVQQISAWDLKRRGLAYSAFHFGSPPVFNGAAANGFDKDFPPDAAQRAVSHGDSVVSELPTGNGSDYVFASTGIHLYGTSDTYGQTWDICYTAEDARCHGGNSRADHYFYYTQAGTCGQHDKQVYDSNVNEAFLAKLDSAYRANTTNTAPIGAPVTSVSISTPSTTSTPPPATTSPAAVPTNQADTRPTTTAASKTGSASHNLFSFGFGAALMILGAALPLA